MQVVLRGKSMKKISHNNIPNENEPVMLCFFAPQKSTAGFSTLELLIAFAVLTLSLTAVILVAFGNQSVAIDTELAQRALYLAAKNLDEAGALAISDFDALGDKNN